MKLRQLFREQEEPQVADVIVFWLEGTKTVRHILYDVPLDFIRAPDFEEKLRRIVRRNFNQVMIRYQVSGDTTSQGNPDGNTPDTEMPTVITSKDNEEEPPVDQRPDEIEAPEPEAEPEPEEVELDTFEPEMDFDDIEQPSDPDRVSVTLIDGRIADFKDWQRDQGEPISELAVVETGPQEGALIDRETMEIVGAVRGTEFAQTYQDAVDAALEQIEATGQSAIMPDNYVGVIGPESAAPAQGGGADGDTGDEGVEGEEGAVTGEQRAEIPSIIEELYRSISGLGTNETRMINALKRIGSPAHLKAVVEMYRETYNSSLPQDIIDEFRFQGGNTGKVIDEVNAVMRPLGQQLVGSQWFNLRWVKAEEENADGEEGDAGADEASDPNGIVEGQFGIGWNTNTDSWVIMIPVVWEGERFLVLSNKSEGFLGTGLGAKYYGGRRDPETGEVTPTTAVVDDDLIDALDALVEEKPWIQNDVIPAEAGDPITPFTQAQLRAVGRDEGTEGETLSIDDAEAINQGPQN